MWMSALVWMSGLAPVGKAGIVAAEDPSQTDLCETE